MGIDPNSNTKKKIATLLSIPNANFALGYNTHAIGLNYFANFKLPQLGALPHKLHPHHPIFCYKR